MRYQLCSGEQNAGCLWYSVFGSYGSFLRATFLLDNCRENSGHIPTLGACFARPEMLGCKLVAVTVKQSQRDNPADVGLYQDGHERTGPISNRLRQHESRFQLGNHAPHDPLGLRSLVRA
jgi:hypothetical protein